MTDKRTMLRRALERTALESGDLPLAPSQERIWLLEQLTPSTALHNIAFSVRIRGRLRVDALERALTDIAQRHHVLRSTVRDVDGRPLLVVMPDLTIRLAPPRPVPFDLHESVASDEADRPFDLERGPLFRAVLLQGGEECFTLVLVVHHLVFDGWSVAILGRELTALYAAYCDGEASRLPPLPLQFSDYARWQRDWVATPRAVEQTRALCELLATAPLEQGIPTDRARPLLPSVAGAEHSFEIPASLSDTLAALARSNGATLFMALMAVFKTTVFRYSGRIDLVVGTPVANRPDPATESLIGPFVNAVPIRTHLGGRPTLLEVLQRVRDAVLSSLACQAVPFERVVDALGVPRALNRTPVFQLFFSLQNTAATPLALGDLHVHCEAVRTPVAAYDLSMAVWPSDPDLAATINYSTDLFDASTIARFAKHFLRIATQAIARPERRIDDFEIMDEEDRTLAMGHSAPADARRAVTLRDVLTASLEGACGTAVEQAGRQLTFRELAARTDRLAAQLRGAGVGAEVGVGLFLPRSIEWIEAMVGIMRSGGFFVPLDPDDPPARLSRMCEQVPLAFVLTDPSLARRLPPHVRSMTFQDLEGRETPPMRRGPCRSTLPENLAYVVYTSGSTGTPKAVMITQAGISNRMSWEQRWSPVTPSDRILQLSPISFDASIWEALRALLGGACLVILNEREDLSRVAETVRRAGITHLTLVPSMLRALIDDTSFGRESALTHVVCSGEALSCRLSTAFHSRSAAALHNFYGPSEASIDAAFWTCRRDAPEPGTEPIGAAVGGMCVYVLDQQMRPVPPGVPGELYIGGVGVARGYWGRPDLTAERFVPDPLAPTPGARLYRTGDRGRLGSDGALQFLGRDERLAKVRGIRVELDEIENELKSHAAVREAAVVVRAPQSHHDLLEHALREVEARDWSAE